MNPTKAEIATHGFLAGMYSDSYFPKSQIDKVKSVLIDLCITIENQKPVNPDAFLALTHAATERINDLAEDFEENGSELETVAREVIASDFRFIADAYGFSEVDIEEIIAPRDW